MQAHIPESEFYVAIVSTIQTLSFDGDCKAKVIRQNVLEMLDNAPLTVTDDRKQCGSPS